MVFRFIPGLALAISFIAGRASAGGITTAPGSAVNVPRGSDASADAETLRVTPETAEAMFLKQNLRLLAARYDLQASEADLIAARLFPNPQFSVNTSFIDVAAKPVDFSASQTSYRIDELIELWGKRGKRIDAAEHSVEGARADLQNSIIQAVSDLKETVLDVAFAQKSYDLATTSYEIFRQSVDIAGVRYRTGDISEAEVKKLQLAQLDYQQSLSDATQNLADALARFRSMLNLGPSVPVRLTYDFHPAMAAVNRDSLIAQALRSRPDVVSGREKALSQQRQVELAHASAWPDLTLGIELDRQGPNFKNTLGGGIGITLPIFNRNQDGIERAEAEFNAASAGERAREAEAANEVSAAFEKYENSRKIMETISPSEMQNAEEVRAMAAKNYNSGNIGLVDFLETERIYNDAVQSYYNALKRFAVNQVELERSTGSELFQEKTQ